MKLNPIAFLAALVVLAVLAAACGGSESPADSASRSGDAASGARAALGEGDADAGGIFVSGQGIAVAEPDIASLSLGVSTLRDSARGARDHAAALMSDLIASLKDNDIDDEDFHTTQFSIDPEIDFRLNGEQVIRGYRVTSTLSVTVRDLDRVGEMIDDAVDAVGDPIRVRGVTFNIDDPGALRSEARALAMADAKAKAGELAEQGEVELGKPTSISETSSGGPPPVFFDLRAAQAQEEISTPITPGQLEVIVTVQVTYVIQ